MSAPDERHAREWLAKHLPDLCRPEAHPAALAATLRMQRRYGKENLTVLEHGQAIRGAVQDFEADRAAVA